MTEVFIGAVIVALIKATKLLSDKVSGLVTFIVAIGLGALVGWIDIHIGLPDVSIATGIMIALAAVGAHTIASSVNTKAS